MSNNISSSFNVTLPKKVVGRFGMANIDLAVRAPNVLSNYIDGVYYNVNGGTYQNISMAVSGNYYQGSFNVEAGSTIRLKIISTKARIGEVTFNDESYLEETWFNTTTSNYENTSEMTGGITVTSANNNGTFELDFDLSVTIDCGPKGTIEIRTPATTGGSSETSVVSVDGGNNGQVRIIYLPYGRTYLCYYTPYTGYVVTTSHVVDDVSQ